MESDVDVTSLGIFLRKRVEEPTRRFVWTLFKKKLKKRDEKSSLTSDEYLEAEKERLPKSHEANCFSLSLSLSLSLVGNTLIFLSLRDDPPNPHFIPHIMATFSAAKVC